MAKRFSGKIFVTAYHPPCSLISPRLNFLMFQKLKITLETSDSHLEIEIYMT